MSEFLIDLARRAKAAEYARNAARTALNDAIHFGRSQDIIDELTRKLAALDPPPAQGVRVPGPVLDPVSVEYAAVGGPRKWAEGRVLSAAGNAALDAADGPSLEALDAVKANALIASRLDRLSPEQKAQSIASVAFQAMDDARVAQMQKQAAAARQRAQAQAIAGSLGAAALAGIAGRGLVDVGSRDVQGALQDNSRALDDRLMAAMTSRLMDRATEDIDFGTDDLVNAAAADAMRVPDASRAQTDIFTEDPLVVWDAEDPDAAIQRVLEKRYSRR